jgi:hypothetical protein
VSRANEAARQETKHPKSLVEHIGIKRGKAEKGKGEDVDQTEGGARFSARS